MTEKMGGAEGTKLDVDFVDMERVSSIFVEGEMYFRTSWVCERSAFHIFARSLCENVKKEMTSMFYLLVLLLNFKDFTRLFLALLRILSIFQNIFLTLVLCEAKSQKLRDWLCYKTKFWKNFLPSASFLNTPF